MSAKDAYVAAGFTPRTDADAEAARTLGAGIAAVTQADVLTGLMAEARYTGAGASHAARVQTWATIGKHPGMFPRVVEHEHAGPGGGPVPGTHRL
jgi:hypothetical protein